MIIKILLVFLVGAFSGFLNTLAGSGSMLTLPLLIFLGLDANTANGTNRLSLMMQTFTSVYNYSKEKFIEKNLAIRVAIPAIIGSISGALLAVKIKPVAFNLIIATLLIVMVILMALNPEKWLKEKEVVCSQKRKIVQFTVNLLLGFYGGFIQASAGFFWLAAFVLISGMNLFKANIYKNLVIMLYIPFSFAIFALNRQVNYFWGLMLGTGSVLGAYIATKISIKKGSHIIRIATLAAISVAAIKLLWDSFF